MQKQTYKVTHTEAHSEFRMACKEPQIQEFEASCLVIKQKDTFHDVHKAIATELTNKNVELTSYTVVDYYYNSE